MRNQEFFRAGEFSWNKGTSINIDLQHKIEKPRMVKICGLFAWKLLKIAFLMKNLPIYDHSQGIFFPLIRTHFPFFEKGQGRPPPAPPSSYAPVRDLLADAFFTILSTSHFKEANMFISNGKIYHYSHLRRK